MKEKRRSGDDWHIDVEQANMTMASNCFTQLANSLYSIDPQVTYPFLGATKIEDHISYAAGYFLEHVNSLGGVCHALDVQLHEFFTKHFLKWLEIMVLSRYIGSAVAVTGLQKLLEWTNVSFKLVG